LFVATVEHNLRTGAGESLGYRKSQPSVRPGHERDPARKVEDRQTH
jgi:hypothetical protein